MRRAITLVLSLSLLPAATAAWARSPHLELAALVKSQAKPKRRAASPATAKALTPSLPEDPSTYNYFHMMASDDAVVTRGKRKAPPLPKAARPPLTAPAARPGK